MPDSSSTLLNENATAVKALFEAIVELSRAQASILTQMTNNREFIKDNQELLQHLSTLSSELKERTRGLADHFSRTDDVIRQIGRMSEEMSNLQRSVGKAETRIDEIQQTLETALRLCQAITQHRCSADIPGIFEEKCLLKIQEAVSTTSKEVRWFNPFTWLGKNVHVCILLYVIVALLIVLALITGGVAHLSIGKHLSWDRPSQETPTPAPGPPPTSLP